MQIILSERESEVFKEFVKLREQGKRIITKGGYQIEYITFIEPTEAEKTLLDLYKSAKESLEEAYFRWNKEKAELYTQLKESKKKERKWYHL